MSQPPRVPPMRRNGIELAPAPQPPAELHFGVGEWRLSPLHDEARTLVGYRLTLARTGLVVNFDFDRLSFAEFSAATTKVRELGRDAGA